MKDSERIKKKSNLLQEDEKKIKVRTHTGEENNMIEEEEQEIMW